MYAEVMVLTTFMLILKQNFVQTHHLVSRRVRKIAKSEYKLRICLSTLNSAVPTRRIFTEFGI
jgi:hypothetical protein